MKIVIKIQNAIYKKAMRNSTISNGVNELAELDTAIVGYNQRFPNVAFPISQATEFAYPPTLFGRACPPDFWRNDRLGAVVAEAKTKQDGSFEIDGVEEGTYNLVAEKAEFG